MNNVVVGLAVVVVLSGIYFFNKEEPKVVDNARYKQEQKMTREEIKRLNAQIAFLQDRLNSMATDDKDSQEVAKLKDQLNALKNTVVVNDTASFEPPKEIEGYSEVYDYIEKNDLKPMFEEQDTKKLKDGTPYNIYSNDTDTGYKEGITPPTTPVATSINVNGEELFIIVGSSTQQVAVLTTPEQGTQKLVVAQVTETNTADDISPPVPPSLLTANSGDSSESSFAPPSTPTLGTGSALPDVPDESVPSEGQ
jgi:hypothetical protein